MLWVEVLQYCLMHLLEVRGLFSFFQDGGGAHIQHPRGITNPAGIQGHIHDVPLDVGRLTGVGVLQEKRAPTLRTRPAPKALLAFRHRAMAQNIRPLAVGTMQHLGIIVARSHTGGSVPLRHPSRIPDQ
jgi:hypothetical protein